MRKLLALIAVNFCTVKAVNLAQVVCQYSRSRAFLTVYIASALARYVRKAVYPQRIALGDHESLKSADAADKISVVLGKIFSHEAEVILARARIEQMAAGGMRLAAFYRHYAAH